MYQVQSQAVCWRFAPLTWVMIILTTVFMLLAFQGGLAELVNRWNKQEEYSHGYLIPLVTIYLVWQKRGLLKHLQYTPCWSGLLLVVIGSAILFIGEFAALYLFVHYAFVMVLIGLALAVMGVRGTKLIIVPVLILLFAIPLPYFIDSDLSGELQLLSSQLGVAVIRVFDIPVYLEGNIIDLGIFKLQVVEACSGLRYLYPLLGFSFICVYLWKAAMWKKVIVFLSAIPITIAMNSLRIGLIGVLMEYYGMEVAEGFMHDFEGWIIFMVCVVMLFSLMWLLSIITGDKGKVFQFSFSPEQGNEKCSSWRVRDSSGPFIASSLMVAIAAGGVALLTERVEALPKRDSFITFPMQLGDWQGTGKQLTRSVIQTLKLTDYIQADYTKNAGTPVNLYIAYYESQRKGESPHSPRVCIPGGGWQITKFERLSLPLTQQAKPSIRLNRVLITRGEDKQLVYYWFQQRGRILANEYTVKWFLLRDAIVDNRTDGALVRLVTPIAENETIGDGDRRLQGFASSLLTRLDRYIPE